VPKRVFAWPTFGMALPPSLMQQRLPLGPLRVDQIARMHDPKICRQNAVHMPYKVPSPVFGQMLRILLQRMPSRYRHFEDFGLQFLLMTPDASTSAAPVPVASANPTGPVTMSIDIGGSKLKAMLLDAAGKPVSERQRVLTPAVPTPDAVLAELDELRKLIGEFDRVSIGFPGVIKRGTTWTAANLHQGWVAFPLQAELEKRWQKPVRVCNDAAVQGYGAIQGHGVELALTLGTGLGSSLFTDGRLCPGLELAHHPWRKKGMTYEDYLGQRGLDKFGKARWNDFLQAAIRQTAALFNWDHLYLGGGNTKKIDFEPGPSVKIVPNETGLLGGVALWRDQG
jgi:polyphosphate glucokinase